MFPYLVSGSIIVSIVLGLPTVGPLLVKALVAQDMFLAGTIVLLLGVMTVIGTFISDTSGDELKVSVVQSIHELALRLPSKHRSIMSFLANALREVIAVPEMRKRLQDLGIEPRTSTPAEMANVFERDRRKWAQVIQQANIKA